MLSLSIGLGINSITKSSIVWTPLFLKDEPQTIGTILFAIHAARSAANISASVIEFGSSKNFSINVSSNSAIASNNLPLHSFASSIMSSGIGTSLKVIPWSCSFHSIPRKLIKSTTPRNVSSEPIGNCNGVGLPPNTSFTCFTTFKKSAPERSILLTKPIRVTL